MAKKKLLLRRKADKKKIEEGKQMKERFKGAMKKSADELMDPKKATPIDKKAMMKEFDKDKKKLKIYRKK